MDNEWLTIGVERNGTQLKNISNGRIKIRVTKNHMIFVKRNREITEIPASELVVGDTVLVPSEIPSVVQEQVLLGGLLGDSSAYPNSDDSRYNGIGFLHSAKQEEYVRYKHNLLGNMSKEIKKYVDNNSYGKEKIKFFNE